MKYKLRVSYSIQVEGPAECDAMNAALSDVPDGATHVKMEVTGKFNAPPETPKQEAHP